MMKIKCEQGRRSGKWPSRDPRQELPKQNDQLMCPEAWVPGSHEGEQRGRRKKSKEREGSTKEVTGTRHCRISQTPGYPYENHCTLLVAKVRRRETACSVSCLKRRILVPMMRIDWSHPRKVMAIRPQSRRWRALHFWLYFEDRFGIILWLIRGGVRKKIMSGWGRVVLVLKFELHQLETWNYQPRGWGVRMDQMWVDIRVLGRGISGTQFGVS